MKNWNMKAHFWEHQEEKIFRVNITKGKSYLQKPARDCWEMKTEINGETFYALDCKPQYWQDGNSYIQTNLYQNPRRLYFFVETDKMLIKFYRNKVNNEIM